ncbi:MAG: hypothetical protein HQM00_17115 [Magnetococcales bacterium]|nr:hypothetical protein [Magnetococcales bacterium]
MDEWITIRNDAHLALTRAEERSRELKERFKQIKRKIIQLSILAARAENDRERSLAAYTTNPQSARLQDELTEARERVARLRQEMNDLETFMVASKGEFRLLSREIPVLRKAYADSEQLYWFAMFETLRARIRHTVGDDVEKAYAAYAASFTRDLSREAFLNRLFGEIGDGERLQELRRELAKSHPLPATGEAATRSLTAPEEMARSASPSPGDEARQWAQMVRG